MKGSIQNQYDSREVKVWMTTASTILTSHHHREEINLSRTAEKNSDSASNLTTLAHRNSDPRGQEAGGCLPCRKLSRTENSRWRKSPEVIPT